MKFPFTKMHGLGNDFVVFNFTERSFEMSAEQARRIADRHFGVGCDQILIVEKSTRADIDFKYRIFNSDGGEVAQCGNGARCFAAFVHEEGLSNEKILHVETLNGEIVLQRDQTDGSVTVSMGIPQFSPSAIPISAEDELPKYKLNMGADSVEFYAMSIGNPHAVISVKDVNQAPVLSLGPMLERHTFFPERANIGFMQIIDRNNIALRVFERGVGETIACGSGACAATACGIRAGDLDQKVRVKLRGGYLDIEWQGPEKPVMMTGPATTVFKGELLG